MSLIGMTTMLNHVLRALDMDQIVLSDLLKSWSFTLRRYDVTSIIAGLHYNKHVSAGRQADKLSFAGLVLYEPWLEKIIRSRAEQCSFFETPSPALVHASSSCCLRDWTIMNMSQADNLGFAGLVLYAMDERWFKKIMAEMHSFFETPTSNNVEGLCLRRT